MKKAYIIIWTVALAVAVFANPLPPAEVTGVSAFPPEIRIIFYELMDTIDISGYSIYTSQGTATINPGTLIYYYEGWDGNYTLDSSNTSGFTINPEHDTVYTDLEVYGYPIMYLGCQFGTWGWGPPPIEGHSLVVRPYCTYHNWDFRSYCFTFDFADYDPGFTDIVINEISANCTWGNEADFIELYNLSDEAISLDGYKLVCDAIYELPQGAVIPAHGFQVIDEADFPAGFDMDFDSDNIYLINPDTFWPFDGDRLVDEVGWSSHHGENVSFMRFPDGDVDSTISMNDFRGYNDATSTTFENGFPTRGAPNRHECPGFVVIGARADSVDDGTARIHWTAPIWDDSFTASALVMSNAGYPSSIYDGELVYAGTAQEYTEEFMVPDLPYYYTVFARDYGGEYSIPTSESQAFIQFHSMGIGEKNLPENVGYLNCYPNPFNAQTTISFSLTQPGNVEISIYDIAGRLVETLTDEFYPAGNHAIEWRAEGLASGIYIARMIVGETISTSRMVLLK